MRGDCYLFRGEDALHLWVRGGYDGWRESIWADMGKSPEADAGVSIPEATMDRFVLMRLAELVVDKRAVATLDAMWDGLSREGNGGEINLRENRDLVREALQTLEDRSSGRSACDV